MPIHLERAAPAIYIASWVDPVYADDIVRSLHAMHTLLWQYGDVEHVTILDLSRCGRLPASYSEYAGLAAALQQVEFCSTYILHCPPPSAQVLADVLTRLTRKPVIHTTRMGDALDIARATLGEAIAQPV